MAIGAPNGKKISADKAGVAVTDRGFINVDIQMCTNLPHIFAIGDIGDIVGQPMLAHKAVHEAHVAAEMIAGELQGNKELAAAAFNARVIPSVAYTDPEVAWVGQRLWVSLARQKVGRPCVNSGRGICLSGIAGFFASQYPLPSCVPETIAAHRQRPACNRLCSEFCGC